MAEETNETLVDDVIKESSASPQARKGKAQKRSSKRAPKKSSGSGTLTQRQLKEFTAGISGIVYVVNNYDGEILLGKSDELAEALYELAQNNPKVKSALIALVTGSSFMGMASVSVAILIPILANHGILPRETATFVGAPEPPKREPKQGRPRTQQDAAKTGGKVPPTPHAPSDGESPTGGVVAFPTEKGENANPAG